jgi:hypothetical protein
MHGIERISNLQESFPLSTRISRIVVRYWDERTLRFEPEAGREFFSEDDALELAKVFDKASSAAEWAEAGDIAGAGG